VSVYPQYHFGSRGMETKRVDEQGLAGLSLGIV